MIIGITSFLAAGKGTVSEMLKEKDFEVHSCSDIIREECREQNIEITRDNLQKVGNELREKYGPNILAERLATKIKKDLTKNYVVESIRTPPEIEELKQLSGFTLVFIDANSRIRYERAKDRLKEKEHVDSYDAFMKSEQKELESTNPNSQQLLKCKELSEFTLENNDTIENLKAQVNDLLLKIQVKQRQKADWNTYFLTIAKKSKLYKKKI